MSEPKPTPEAPASRTRAADLIAPPVATPRRVAAGLFGFAAAFGVLVAGMFAWLNPETAPFIAPLVVLVGALGLWGAHHADQRRFASDLERLTRDNRNMAETIEQLSDAAWELRESEERYRSLIEARQRAEEASEAKSRVLATVSHEFRTPLNGILGLTGLLLETNLTPDQETYARAVHSSGEALLALVDDMLDFSRIEAGRLELHPAPTGIEALLQEIAELLAGRAHAKGIDIAVEIGPDVPATVTVDAARLRQVLINLVGNGVKFTETGGVTLAAAVGRAPEEGHVAIAFSVADTGPGIAASDVERLFGEFEQSDGALNRRHGGAGLGLAISRRIVRRMGSDLYVTPGPKGGSVFRFTLDLKVVDAAPAEDTTQALAGRSVLVVAPEGTEAPVLARHLAACGATARVVANTTEAAALIGAATAAGQPHDAVLVDARVAGEPGTALARIREAADRHIPAAVLIEPGRRGDIEGLRDGGFDAYLVRPVRRGSLLRVVGDIVEGSGDFCVDPGDVRPRQTATRSARAGAGLNVLLAEDNEINALLARAVLEGLGHEVTEVHDGAGAIEAVTARPERGFDAILMDLHMPGLDGLAAVRAIRDHERRTGMAATAILALTADVLQETRAEATAAGVDGLLEKPMTPDALRRALADITARRAA